MTVQESICNLSKEELEKFMLSNAKERLNCTIPEKCSYCNYMFDFKCRAEKCIKE